MKADTSILDRLYAMEGGPETCRDIYADWANDYDRDTLDGMGYVGPSLVAEALAERISSGARILDAGCGTGLAGEQLAASCASTASMSRRRCCGWRAARTSTARCAWPT